MSSISESATHNNILSSDNPDKQYEYFWLTFKDAIIEHLPSDLKINIVNLSSTLNQLQKEKKYDKIFELISNFMNTHIKEICHHILISKNYNAVWFLQINIRRWCRINEIFDTNTIDIKLCFILSNCMKKDFNNIEELFLKIIELVKLYNIPDVNRVYITNNIEDIFSFGIENKLTLLLDELRIYVNLEKFKKDGIDLKIHKHTKSIKFLNLFKVIK